MTKFDKTKFSWDGMYLTYGADRNFVARFKYARGDRAKFTLFLCKNFTVEEYFTELSKDGSAPMTILESKGYVSATIAKILKQAGYPITQKGKDDYLKDQAALRAERFSKG